jgi:predicted CXXCH cytochrome family protein
MLLIAAGSLWLFLAAVPVFADGGPHVAAINNGTGVNGVGVLSSDSCAGCHRIHRAQTDTMLIDKSAIDTCLACHGAAGTGATVDVENGRQYTYQLTPNDPRSGTLLGYTRAGGFVTARIGSGEAYRVTYDSGTRLSQNAKVPVRSAGSQAVTSAHLPNTAGVVEAADGVAWGNGPDSATAYAGPAVEMECTSCHNPHGNGNYRILNPVPDPAATGVDPFITATAPGALVADAQLPPRDSNGNFTDERNYTIIQTNGGTGTLLASQVAALKTASSLPDTAGDYFRKKVPWNATTTAGNDAPNGQSATFTTQIAAWCITCHSRYLSAGRSVETTDAIYTYRHTSASTQRNCITCHVAHGSNAQMTGVNSATQEMPGGATAPVGDSRLLKVDNRGTCQLCHDPTGTITAGTAVGTVPVPLLP